MTFWRQAMASVLLMVFSSASVLAGTPLRICVGEDGHRAVEFVLSTSHHHSADHDTARRAQIEDAGVASLVSDGTDCSDSPLLSVVQKPTRAAQMTVVLGSDDVAIFKAPAPFVVGPDFDDALLPSVRAFDVGAGNAQLDALRTIVLLI